MVRRCAPEPRLAVRDQLRMVSRFRCKFVERLLDERPGAAYAVLVRGDRVFLTQRSRGRQRLAALNDFRAAANIDKLELHEATEFSLDLELGDD